MFDLGKLHFAPDAGKYRTDNALICALLSALSYKREAIIRTTLRDNGFRHVHYFTHEKVDTQCLIASKDKTLFAVFRGTQVFEMKDWNTNRKVLMVGGPLGKIHRGFLLALTSVWAEVSDCIDTLLKKTPGQEPVVDRTQSWGSIGNHRMRLSDRRESPHRRGVYIWPATCR